MTTYFAQRGAFLIVSVTVIAVFIVHSSPASDVIDLLGPPCGDHCKDLLGPMMPATRPSARAGRWRGPGTGDALLAEWLDRLLNTSLASRVVTVFDFEAAWLRGYRECGPGCAVVDIGTKSIAAIGGAAVTSTAGLALIEVGPAGAAVAASLGVIFADQLERALRNTSGFEAARADIAARINARWR
jgi:hypothetical protein